MILWQNQSQKHADFQLRRINYVLYGCTAPFNTKYASGMSWYEKTVKKQLRTKKIRGYFFFFFLRCLFNSQGTILVNTPEFIVRYKIALLELSNK